MTDQYSSLEQIVERAFFAQNTKKNYKEMSNKINKINRPSFLLLTTEPGRAAVEYGAFLATETLLKRDRKGDGRPVLVLPGFMTTDRSTSPLRGFLNDIGYTAYTWGLGRNLGDYRYVLDSVNRVHDLYKKHRRKVSIIGWSLGGVYAREIARQCPNMVRQVITLGSPFRGLTQANNVAWIYKLLSGKDVTDLDPELLANIHTPPPVPVTAIYSKKDGIVPWQYCTEEEESPHVQNVEINGSHCGLGHNPAVLYCVADRLAQSTRSWQPFEVKPFADYFLSKMDVQLNPA